MLRVRGAVLCWRRVSGWRRLTSDWHRHAVYGMRHAVLRPLRPGSHQPLAPAPAPPLHASPHPHTQTVRCTWWPSRCARWRRAACGITWGEASTATLWTSTSMVRRALLLFSVNSQAGSLFAARWGTARLRHAHMCACCSAVECMLSERVVRRGWTCKEGKERSVPTVGPAASRLWAAGPPQPQLPPCRPQLCADDCCRPRSPACPPRPSAAL